MTSPKADKAGPVTWIQRLQQVASVVAPTTVVASLLFYFGYVATYARYLYFGIDLTALDLSTFEVLLHGAEVLYVPLAALILIALVIYSIVRGVRYLLERRRRGRLLAVLAVAALLLGVIALVRGTIGVLSSEVSHYEFPGTTPIALGICLPLLNSGLWILRANKRDPDSQLRVKKRRPTETAVVLGSAAMAILGTFWATNSFAAAYGRGIAETVAAEIADRPAVTLDSEERLYLTLPGINETALPIEEGQKFKYRYRGLYMLLEAGGRLFLVSAADNGRAGTIVVPYDGSLRIQFSAN